jgi:hypothetical protein
VFIMLASFHAGWIALAVITKQLDRARHGGKDAAQGIG